MIASIRPLFLLFILIGLAGCGFQLRGQVDLPAGVEPIYIGGNSSSILSIEIRNLLSAAGIALSEDPVSANHQLIILEQDQDRRTASLDEQARAAEYQLIETIKFELRDQQGKTVLGPSKITERRIMPNDPNQVVSTGEEEQLLRREMAQNLAAKIARQLSAFKYTPAKPANDS